jgi:hypothetical protein
MRLSILSVICQSLITIVGKYNIDVSRVIDDNNRQTSLFYAVTIKNGEK